MILFNAFAYQHDSSFGKVVGKMASPKEKKTTAGKVFPRRNSRMPQMGIKKPPIP
jgi:hypothetical protein